MSSPAIDGVVEPAGPIDVHQTTGIAQLQQLGLVEAGIDGDGQVQGEGDLRYIDQTGGGGGVAMVDELFIALGRHHGQEEEDAEDLSDILPALGQPFLAFHDGYPGYWLVAILPLATGSLILAAS